MHGQLKHVVADHQITGLVDDVSVLQVRVLRVAQPNAVGEVGCLRLRKWQGLQHYQKHSDHPVSDNAGK